MCPAGAPLAESQLVVALMAEAVATVTNTEDHPPRRGVKFIEEPIVKVHAVVEENEEGEVCVMCVYILQLKFS